MKPIPLEKVSFFPRKKFRLRNIKKEKDELIRKVKTSTFSLFILSVLLSTGIIYYSAFLLDFLGVKFRTVIISLTPFWVAISILIYMFVTGEKMKSILKSIKSKSR